ncbi:MAG: hypothetical protein LBG79_02200 [Spirochaetaceae bacterium]|nr:hypothetical protein [Spirochaetaceae bacterium]GMO24162.1 MAG: hypothetical protein Pg6A_11260 [Termitinemataceae bacterium]
MDAQVRYILVHCDSCAAYPCKVKCSAGALVFFSGNLLIEESKCASCPKHGKKLPSCVEECKKSNEKRIIDMLDAEKKRENAVSAFSF